MIAWINLGVLVFASLLFLYFYVLSVRPAAMEMLIGEKAYRRCGLIRGVAMIFESITLVNYVVYYFYPVEVPLPQRFPWPWWLSIVIAVVIGLPAAWLMIIGMRDAGKELAIPDKSHTMYLGIYRHIRHPQAAGEVFLWLAIAFGLHSPFLAIFSLIYFPIFLVMCVAEENDLLIRYSESYAEYMKNVPAFIPKRNK